MKKEATLPQLLFCLLLTISLMFYEAFIFLTLFNWFIPLVTGWNPINNYWLAFGVTVFLNFILLRFDDKVEVEEKSFGDRLYKIFERLAVTSMIFGFAALIHLGV